MQRSKLIVLGIFVALVATSLILTRQCVEFTGRGDTSLLKPGAIPT